MTKKILITNPFGIGDVIFSTPLIEALKKYYPYSYIGYICNRRVSGLISTNPNLDKVFVYEKDEYRKIWRNSKIKCLIKIFSFLKSIHYNEIQVNGNGLKLQGLCQSLFKQVHPEIYLFLGNVE